MSKPVLWHIPVSHYNEKVRWALAYKGIEHDRRAPVPGAHIGYALWLTRGKSVTFPVLSIDGRNIGDSTATISVTDAGEGVPAELVPQLFDRLAAGGASGGTGLGLYLVRQIARAHGGDVSYRAPEDGSPTEFELRLPLPSVRPVSPLLS